MILVFNYLDRVALGLLLQDIKADLRLSDSELGFVTGLAFAFFYAVAGIPLARWADRGNRVTITAVTTAIWSVAVMLCGTVRSYMQLVLLRVAVGVGEAGCIPTAHSLIADYFARAERPRAASRYMLGIPLSMVIGYLMAGWLNEAYGWRKTFALLGLPGLGLAGLAWFTLIEPRARTGGNGIGDAVQQDVAEETGAGIGVKEVCTILWSTVTFRHLLISYSVLSFFGWGIQQWKPAFFIRSYGLHTSELGVWLAFIYGFSGILGLPAGGELASRYAVKDERLQLRMMALAYCAFGGISACVYLSPSQYVAFALMSVATLGFYTTTGPFFAVLQTLIPARMRAIALAIIYLFANLIGMGLGPWAAGVLSDALRPQYGEESLRYALLALCPGYFWAGWHLWQANRTVMQDLERSAQLHIVELTRSQCGMGARR